MSNSLPYLGFGLRLRREYLSPVLEEFPAVDWFEIISESYLEESSGTFSQLDQIREAYPIVMHGISLAIGSPWPLDLDYLKKLKQLIQRIEPVWVSDHLCWSGADDVQGSMLPLPYSSEMLEHLVPRICEVQEFLGRQILLENVPMERDENPQEIPEAEFLKEVAERSDSLILMDVANLNTSCINRQMDPDAYLRQLPDERIQQIHLAGAVALCDSADQVTEQNADPIWRLYRSVLLCCGPVSTMIERLDTIPSLSEMVKELGKARCAAHRLLDID